MTDITIGEFMSKVGYSYANPPKGCWGVEGQENTIELIDGVYNYCDWCGRALNNCDICDHCGAPAKRKENRHKSILPETHAIDQFEVGWKTIGNARMLGGDLPDKTPEENYRDGIRFGLLGTQADRLSLNDNEIKIVELKMEQFVEQQARQRAKNKAIWVAVLTILVTIIFYLVGALLTVLP